jgi:hypothetical protein
MTALPYKLPAKHKARAGASPHLTLMDLYTALCEETDDDKLVAAAVIDLFRRGYVKFQDN